MTVFDCSIHTHADLCDGKEPLSAMAAGFERASILTMDGEKTVYL